MGVLLFLSKETDPLSKSFFYVPFIYWFISYFSIRNILKSKIKIDDFGLTYESGLPEIFKIFHPDWRVSWYEIKEATAGYNFSGHKTLKPLKLSLLSKKIVVFPRQWINPKEFVKSPWFTFSRSEKFEDSALVKIFEEKGFFDVKRSAILSKAQSAWVEKSLGTDINSHPISLSMVVFLFFSIFYFIIEVYFTLSEFYASIPPYLYMLIGSIIALIISCLLLLRTEFKLVEKVILAVMMGFSVAAVTYPLMLRVNEWTDDEGLQSYSNS